MAKRKAATTPPPPRPEVMAFHDAIRDDPEDDTPRLVLADWLEEHGRDEADSARARFLRLGCEVAKRPALGGGDPEAKRYREVYAENRARWFPHLLALRGKAKGTIEDRPHLRGLAG